MAEKSLIIQIGTTDLSLLKQSGYNLCLAKKVDGYDFNVVWHAYSNFLASNTFQWTPAYELFCSTSFVSGKVVQESVQAVPIDVGQQSTLDSFGILSPAVNGNVPTAIVMKNNYGTIYPGINQQLTDFNGQSTIDPIFVTKNPVIMGVVELVPVELVLLWFEQGIQTGTMFSQPPQLQGKSMTTAAQSWAFLVDFSQVNQRTVVFQNQRWSFGSSSSSW